MMDAMCRTLEILASRPRLTAPAMAAVLWPGKDPEPRKSIAEGRLRAAAQASYAHVAFEPVISSNPLLRWRVATYAISAAGRAVIGQRPCRRPRTQGHRRRPCSSHSWTWR